MSAKRRFLWWMDPVAGAKDLIGWSIFMFFVFGYLKLSHQGIPALYAIFSGVVLLLFRFLSCELGALLRNETLRLAPGFVPGLQRGVLQCVALVAGVGTLFSAGLQSWLPLAAMVYTVTVLACLQLPTSEAQREISSEKRSAGLFGAENFDGRAVVALFLPLPALHLFPAAPLLWALGGLSVVFILILPHCLNRAARTASLERITARRWQPSLEVFVCAFAFAALPFMDTTRNGSFNLPTPILMVMLWMGNTTVSRRAPELRVQLGRMWLAGRSRHRLCLSGMWRLLLALSAEYAIYAAIMLTSYVSGLLSLEALGSVAALMFFIGMVNWSRGIEIVLYGAKSDMFWEVWRRSLKRYFLPVAIPMIYLAFLIDKGRLLSVSGGAGVLVLITVFACWLWDHLRRFEVAELW